MCQESFPFYFYTVAHSLGSHKLLILIGTKITSIFAFSTFPRARLAFFDGGAATATTTIPAFPLLLSRRRRPQRRRQRRSTWSSTKKTKCETTVVRNPTAKKNTQKTGRGVKKKSCTYATFYLFILVFFSIVFTFCIEATFGRSNLWRLTPHQVSIKS